MAYLGNKYGIYADPSFQMGMALGNAYGNMWAANAKKRQEKQLDDYIEEQANADLMANVNAAQTNNYDLSKGATPMLDRLDGQRTSVDKILDNMSMATGGVEFIKSQADMNPVQRVKDRYKNLSVDNVTAWAKKNGINQEVLNERLASLQKEVATNVGAVMLPEITRNLYSGNVDNILTGMQQLDELKQYDPAAYERYSKVADQQLARRQAFNDNVALANIKGSNKPVYRISDAANKNAVDLIGTLTNKEALGTPLTTEEKVMLQNAQQLNGLYNLERGIGAVSNATNSAQDNRPPFNAKNWGDIKTNIDIAKQAGAGAEAIIAELVKNGVTGKELEQSYNYLGIETEAQKAKREQEKQNLLFPKDESGNVKGLTNTVRPNEEVKTAILYGKPLWNIAHR